MKTRYECSRFATTFLVTAALIAGMGLTSSIRAQQSDEAALPGSEDAIEQAVELAILDAVGQMTATLPAEVNAVAVVPLFKDTGTFATDALQHALIQQGATSGFRVLNRDDAGWMRLLAEFEFTEDNFDIMASDEVRQFGKVLGADAIIWGQVIHRGLDDTGLKGHGSVQLYLGVVETGQLAASGRSNRKVLLDQETVLLWLIQQTWFWALLVVGFIAAVAFVIIWVPLRRKMALATKPREVVR